MQVIMKGGAMDEKTEEEKVTARRERKRARAAIDSTKNRQNPERVANAKAYHAAWRARKKQDPDWVAEQAAKLEQKRQDPEWVENKKARGRAYYAEQKANGTNYYERLKTNPEKLAKKRDGEKEWKKNKLERWKEIQKNSDKRKKQKDPVKFLLTKTKAHAKSKGIEFNIESTDFVMPEMCPVLGIPITPFEKGLAPGTPSFDRIDPCKGYVKGNVKIISYRANRLKCDCIDPAELRAVADYIEQNLLQCPA